MGATILLADHTGRLGNKLILFAHVIAAAEEYGCRVINLSILPAAHYFEGLNRNPLGTYPGSYFPWDLRWLIRALRKPIQKWVRGRRGKSNIRNRWFTVLDMENKPVYRLDSPEFANLTRTTRWIILWGYPYRCSPLVLKHANRIRAFLKIRSQTAPVLSQQYSSAVQSGRDTIAIHIRQGDFKEWNQGSYYISPEKTFSALSANSLDIRDPQRHVWVCSDEPIPKDLFPGEATAQIPRELGEDLFIMSNCRMVVGCQSTLSFFCAFLGASHYKRLQYRDLSLFEIDPSSLEGV